MTTPTKPQALPVVGRAHLEHHLVLVAQVDPLGQLALGHRPEVQVVAEPPAKQVLGVETVFDMDGVAHSEVMPAHGDVGDVLLHPSLCEDQGPGVLSIRHDSSDSIHAAAQA
jgi:hypothetical protein